MPPTYYSDSCLLSVNMHCDITIAAASSRIVLGAIWSVRGRPPPLGWWCGKAETEHLTGNVTGKYGKICFVTSPKQICNI